MRAIRNFLALALIVAASAASAASGYGVPSFVQDGAGAIGRTFQDKARERISVKDFGAKADGGTTDNAAAFAAAITAAGEGGTVYVPAGDNFYGFATGITINIAGVTLEGDGDRSMLVNMNQAGQNLITVDGVQSVHLKRFSMAGHALSGHGIEIKNGAHRGSTESLFCRSMGLDCIRHTAGFGWLHIEPRFSTNFYLPSSTIGPFPYAGASALAENGIKAVQSANTGTLTIIGPLIEGMAGYGLYLDSENSTIIGGTVEGNQANIRIIGNFNKIYGTNTEAPDPGPTVHIEGSWNTVAGMLTGGTYGKLFVESGTGNKIENSTFNEIEIGAAAINTVLDNVVYSSNGGVYTDGGVDTVARGLFSSNNENQRAADKRRESHVNFARNPGFERWVSATSLDGAASGGWSVLNGSTLVRTGDGEADTTKREGHYAVKVTAAATITSGIQYQGPAPDYGDIVGQTITPCVWAKSAGAVPFDIQVNYNGSVYQQSFTTTTAFQKFCASFKVPSGKSSYVVNLVITEASAAAYFDDFYLTLGLSGPYGLNDNLREREPEPMGHHTATFAAEQTIYADAATFQTVTLTANITAFTISNGVPGQPLRLKLTQGGAGSYTVAWNTPIKWPGGSAPTLTTTVGASDIITLMWDGNSSAWHCVGIVQDVR